ncbi:hypothetical protein X956_09240 [Trueperella pyogenes TP8]|nr:hypothetical protein X956_09240 [Trueperella pyogenes TP8]
MRSHTVATIGFAPGARPGDRIFRGIVAASGIGILVLLAAVFIFLLLSSGNVLVKPGAEIAKEVAFARGQNFWQFAGTTVFGTLLAAAIALSIAVPFAVGVALFISHYAPRRLAAAFSYVIDLLAAIPSVVFGLWGMWTLEPLVRPVFTWLSGILTPILTFLSGKPAADGSWGRGALRGVEHASNRVGLHHRHRHEHTKHHRHGEDHGERARAQAAQDVVGWAAAKSAVVVTRFEDLGEGGLRECSGHADQRDEPHPQQRARPTQDDRQRHTGDVADADAGGHSHGERLKGGDSALRTLAGPAHVAQHVAEAADLQTAPAQGQIQAGTSQHDDHDPRIQPVARGGKNADHGAGDAIEPVL